MYEKLAHSHPDLKAGNVKCLTCGQTLTVDSAECVQNGWPICCGYTMILVSKQEAAP